MEEIIRQLNPAQREAVVNFEGPSLIVAGAGSGKTRVLTARIAYMIDRGVAPHSILALTFTNKAAAEMRERIEGMIGPRSRALQMGTFHSVFLRILRAESELLGYPTTFTIYDTSDSQNLIKAICKELSLADNDKYKPRVVFSKISRLKNDLVTPAAYVEDASFVAEDRKRGCPQFLEIYRRYTAQCKANGAMDFDDILLNMVVLFKKFPEALAKYRERFRYVLVDEYQDTNHVQYLIVKALAMAHGNICVVGDDSQSIYSFRGARIENILNFKRDFPGTKLYKLEQNYRSTQVIVSAANGVIARNGSSRELKKECFSAGERGERIKLLKAYTDREEAEMVASEIRQLGREGVQWQDIAVLYRANALSRNIEESLRRRDIPYVIYRGHSFFDRKEIKDLLCYFRLIVNPLDDEAFKRVVNYPARGIGNVTVEKIAAAARERGVSMWETVAEASDRKLQPFAELIRSLSMARGTMPLYEFGREVATRTGIIASYRADNSPESASALENIEELLNSMASEPDGEGGDSVLTLDDWLGNVALMTDMDSAEEPENRNRVTMMTVHAAKGLEFSHVFIIGLEEELFPSVRDGDSSEIEEERRLFYVALTRAKERSFVSMAETRFVHGSMTFRRPSRFLREIGEEYLEGKVGDAREAAEQQRSAWGSRGNSGGYSGGGKPWEASGKPTWSSSGRQQYGPQSASPNQRFERPQQRVEPPTPDARFRKVAPSSAPKSSGVAASAADIVEGARVSHVKFGAGTVNEVESTSTGDLKVTVTFDDAGHGRKTLLSKYARLEKL